MSLAITPLSFSSAPSRHHAHPVSGLEAVPVFPGTGGLRRLDYAASRFWSVRSSFTSTARSARGRVPARRVLVGLPSRRLVVVPAVFLLQRTTEQSSVDRALSFAFASGHAPHFVAELPRKSKGERFFRGRAGRLPNLGRGQKMKRRAPKLAPESIRSVPQSAPSLMSADC
jgi:hypothetical protein